MITLEQVEELRKRANISYDEAKSALEEANGDMLEAIINLEKQNKIKAPKRGGFYSTKNSKQNIEDNSHYDNYEDSHDKENSISIGELLRKIIKFCGKVLDKANKNNFIVIKDEKQVIIIPVTILVLLLIFAFWITIPIMILGLFIGYRYRFSGPDLGKENINRTMDSVADMANSMAESIKKEVKGEKSNGKNSDN